MARGKKWLWLGIIAIALFGALLSAGPWMQASGRYSGPVDKISIGSPLYHSVLILLAEDQGYFVRNGLDVALNLYPYEHTAMEKFELGEIDFTITSEFSFARASLNPGSENLRIIASTATVLAQELVARRDRGISQARELKGKRIGVRLDSVLDFTLDRFLILHAIAPEEITKVSLSYDDCSEAILKGDIDATVLFDLPLDNVKKQLGENAVTWSTNITQPHYWPLIAKQQTMAAKPAVAPRLLNALLEAQAFAITHPEQADAILIRRWNFNPEFLRRSHETTKLEVSLEQSMIEAMEDEAHWLAEKQPPENKREPPNFLRMIHMDALDAVRPKANTILR
jgi:NitT/TauT family transport system substrate-binding protein